jgi:DNA-binding NtrC family response regulator
VRATKILLVDDNDKFRTNVRHSLGRAFLLTEAASETEFRREFRPYTYDLVILDMRLKSGREGLRLLREILAHDELQPVIMVSAYGDTDAVLDSAEAGALMFLHKQEFTPELLTRMVEAVLQQARVRRQLAALQSRQPTGDPGGLAGLSPMIRQAAQLAAKAAEDGDCTVLVTGEPGTGHEFVAQAIHGRSAKRSAFPFVSAWMPGMTVTPKVQRDQLFGTSPHGGGPRRKGLLEQAHGGVLFLGGVESIASGLLAEVTAAVRKYEIQSSEGGFAIPLDVQLVVGATLGVAEAIGEKLVDTSVGERLVNIHLPPLRERPEDVPILAGLFLQEFRQAGKTTARTLSPGVLTVIEGNPWPGNLHELRNAVEFAAIRASIEGCEEVDEQHLPADLRKPGAHQSALGWNYRRHVAWAEVELVEAAIREHRGANKTQLAGILGYTDRFAFGRRMRKLLEEDEGMVADFPHVAALFAGVEARAAVAGSA